MVELRVGDARGDARDGARVAQEFAETRRDVEPARGRPPPAPDERAAPGAVRAPPSRPQVDAFRSREQALLAQIETQKAAFDAREAALRFPRPGFDAIVFTLGDDRTLGS